MRLLTTASASFVDRSQFFIYWITLTLVQEPRRFNVVAILNGAVGGTRTHTNFRSLVFETNVAAITPQPHLSALGFVQTPTQRRHCDEKFFR